MVSQLMKKKGLSSNKKGKFNIVGVDLHSDFVERSIVNFQKYAKHIDKSIGVDFQGMYNL
jgi:hypothetical protein